MNPRTVLLASAASAALFVSPAFADTAAYLYRNLAPDLKTRGYEAAIVTGQGHPTTTVGKGYGFQQTLTLFSPHSKQRHLVLPQETSEIDVLIGTDCFHVVLRSLPGRSTSCVITPLEMT